MPDASAAYLRLHNLVWVKPKPVTAKVQKMIDLKQQRVAAENDDDEDQITVRRGT